MIGSVTSIAMMVGGGIEESDGGIEFFDSSFGRRS